MKSVFFTLLRSSAIVKVFALLCFLISFTVFSQESYEHGPASDVYEKIPKGKLSKHTWKSKVFPNTIRDYYVYVPEQYEASEPAALMVFQDGHTYVKEDGDFKVPTVFDNLIAQEMMPVTIGLFIDPGHAIDSLQIDSPWKASNRSFEYDEVSDTYGRFLIEEMIPELKKNYNISDNPAMRAIGGISSGGICAFSAAWFFPDQFQKVMSHIGSFTNIRGGHNYPTMIRKTEKKNIRVFMQDGSEDLDNEHGNWWLSNLQMESALNYKGYDYEFVKGKGAHNGNHGGAILPESLVWLWGDVLPKRVASGVYPVSDNADDEVLFAGETVHFRQTEFKLVHLDKADGPIAVRNSEKEQIFIVKEGQLEVKVNKKTKTIGANSVVVLLPGDSGSIECLSPKASYYTMVYVSKQKADTKRGKKNGGSSIIDYKALVYKEHDKGGIRNYFNRATAMCPYYEMHVTNLNQGIKSHDPHTHFATEIILITEGTTEMEMGNQKLKAKAGDVYFVPANLPHAIRNIGDRQAQYFAYQWY